MATSGGSGRRPPEAEEGGGDAVEEQDVGRRRATARSTAGPASAGSGKCQAEGQDVHPCVVCRGAVGDPLVVQVSAGHPAGTSSVNSATVNRCGSSTSYPPPFGPAGLFGGGERYPLELARALAKHVDCELLTFGPRAGAWREAGGLRVRVLRRLGLLHGHPVHPVAPQLAWSLGGADIVHTHHLRSAPSRVAGVAAAVAGRHRVTTDHGLGGGGWGGLLPALFERFLTVSEFSAAILGVPRERTRIIYGGVDPARFHPGTDSAAARDGVLYLGRITPHKGVDRLLRALPQAASLTVAGSTGHDPRPPERDYPALLHRLAGGRSVRFIGTVADDDVPQLYRRASVFVLPTVDMTCYGRPVAMTELLGLSVLEAMASGTPVVASRTGGLPEVIRDGETGFLVTPGDVPELHDRLDRLLRDAALARRMGRAARQLVLDRFTWQATAQRCLAAYAELDTRWPTG
jgi:glycosyltransferase involved in cell wall biosynthesis